MATNATIMAARPANAGWRRFGILLQASLAMYIREKAAIFWVVVFPIGVMLLFGAMFGHVRIDPSDPNSLTVISFLVPGLIVLALMSNGLVGNAETLAVYRERGILRRVQTTPLPVWQLLMSRVVTQSAIMVVQAFLMIGISVLVFDARYDALGLVTAIPAIVAGAVMFIAMGQAVASLVRKAQTANIVASAINLPLMFLGGLWMNMKDLPEPLQAFAKYLPSSMVADTLRVPMLSSFDFDFTNIPLAASWAGVLAYFALSVAISARFFKWDSQSQYRVPSTEYRVSPAEAKTNVPTFQRSNAPTPTRYSVLGTRYSGLRRFGLLLQANALMHLRARDYVFWVMVFPVGLMLLFGMIWGQEGPGRPGGLSFISFMVPGLLVLSLMSNGLPGNAETLAVYRERGILRRVQTTPLPLWQFLLAQVMLQVALLIVQALLMVGTSALVFNARYDAWGLLASVPAVVLGAITFMALGQAIAALVRKTSTVNLVTMTLLFPLMFLGNLWQPIEAFPQALQMVSKLLPSTMVVDIVRVPMLAGMSVQTSLPLYASLLGVVAYLLAAAAVAVRFFKWSS
jgi:ABC-2 type transport system permease protein